MKKSKIISDVDTEPKLESVRHSQVGGDLVKHSGMPVDVVICSETNRLNLALKLADALQGIIKLVP